MIRVTWTEQVMPLISCVALPIWFYTQTIDNFFIPPLSLLSVHSEQDTGPHVFKMIALPFSGLVPLTLKLEFIAGWVSLNPIGGVFHEQRK